MPFRSEDLFINEGLSDFAMALIGYAHPDRSIAETKAESHIFCFNGYGEVKGPANPNPNYCGGPENSLTLWEDQGGNSDILADYGNAWSFMLFLNDRYGTPFMSALHKDPDFGLESLQKQLDKFASGTKVIDVLHDYQLMNLVDKTLSAKGAKISGADAKRVTTKSLNAGVNYTYRGAFASPGAAPNGADYVQLVGPNGALSGRDLRSLVFAGAASGPGDVPVENWFVRLVGIDAKGKNVLVKTYDNAANLNLSAAVLAAFSGFKTVLAMITVDDLTESQTAYVPYQLTVNGQLQPGGA